MEGKPALTNITNPDPYIWCQIRKIPGSFSGWSKVHFPILFLEGCSRSIYFLQPLIDPKDWCYCLMMNHPEPEGKSVIAALDTQSLRAPKNHFELFWSPEMADSHSCRTHAIDLNLLNVSIFCAVTQFWTATFAHCHKECFNWKVKF